jgi:cytochrome c biogenesis protein CcmG/thiol:disulfide interchange protein DsbE
LKSLKFLIPLALFVVLLGFLGVGLNLNPREVPSPLIGKPAPAFKLTRLDDASRTIQREELLGRVWMLNVWASWCAPCREEHPLLVEFGKRKLVPIYGLNYKDTRVQANVFLNQLGNPYEASLFDGDGRVGIDFGVYGVPETFIIDRQGVVRLKHVGALTPDVLRNRIEPLLRQLNG